MTIRPRPAQSITPEYTGLPEFSLENVTLANARVDKFEITFPNHEIEFSTIGQFRQYVADMAITDSLFSIYNPTGGVRQSLGLQFRAGRVLMGKRINFNPIYAHENRRRFSVKLQCNFSRFAANCGADNMRQLPAVDWDDCRENGYPRLSRDNTNFSGHAVLEKNTARLNQQIAQSLDRSDNWMRGNVWQATQNVEQQCESYIAACLDYIEEQFFFPLAASGIPTRISDNAFPNPTWSANRDLLTSETGVMPAFDWSGFIIHKAEIYHEFQHENAVDFMRYIVPRIREIAPIINERDHPYHREGQNITEGRRYDAPTVRVQLSRGVYLYVYAKTMHRTRWEIRFPKNIRDTLNDITTTEQSHYAELLAEPIGNEEHHMRDIMRVAIHYATDALHRFIGQLRLDESTNTPPSVIAQFMHHIAMACGNNSAIIGLVLTPLLRDGHITESKLTKAAIAYLSDDARRVLQHARVNKRAARHTAGYRITTPYAGVLEGLRLL